MVCCFRIPIVRRFYSRPKISLKIGRLGVRKRRKSILPAYHTPKNRPPDVRTPKSKSLTEVLCGGVAASSFFKNTTCTCMQQVFLPNSPKPSMPRTQTVFVMWGVPNSPTCRNVTATHTGLPIYRYITHMASASTDFRQSPYRCFRHITSAIDSGKNGNGKKTTNHLNSDVEEKVTRKLHLEGKRHTCIHCYRSFANGHSGGFNGHTEACSEQSFCNITPTRSRAARQH